MTRARSSAGNNPRPPSRNSRNSRSNRRGSRQQSRVSQNASNEHGRGREIFIPGLTLRQLRRVQGRGREIPNAATPRTAQNSLTTIQQQTGSGNGNQETQNRNIGANATIPAITGMDQAKRLAWLIGFGAEPCKKLPDRANLLPEPALTSLFPQDAATENNSRLLTLAAVAAQPINDPHELHRLIISRLNRGPDPIYWPAGFFKLIMNHNLPWNNNNNNNNNGTKILPSLDNPKMPEPEDPTQLTQLQVVINDIVLGMLKEMDKNTVSRLRREFQLLISDMPERSSSGRKLVIPPLPPPGQQSNFNAPQASQDVAGGNTVLDPNDHVFGNSSSGPNNVPKKTLLCTPKTVNFGRLKDRGHSNGFVSFGELLQADMPSASLSHFALTKGTVAQYHHFQVVEVKPKGQFNIFREFLARPDFTIKLAKHLRVQELAILYSVSRRFHEIVRLRLTTVLVSQAKTRAPDSARTFPFRCYSRLCVDDPARRPHPVEEKAAAGEVRKVPSLKWLQMVCFREMVCHEIMALMAEDGVTVPDQCEPVLKKIWFLIDIPDTPRRIGMVQNREIFTDTDIFFAVLFFVKVDMRFTDPITGNGRDGMRRLVMAQPSLSTLWRALKRTALVAKLDVVKMFIRWKYQPRPSQVGQSLFGIPPNEVGIMQYEGWGRTGSRVPLQRPDELLLMESIRRNLKLENKYSDMFMWGYINPNTMEDLPPIKRKRKLDTLEGLEEDLTPVEDRGLMLPPKRVSTRVSQQ